MRKVLILWMFLTTIFNYGQITTSTKWGKVSQEEIDYKRVSFEAEAPAVILYEQGSMTVLSNLETEVYRRIKILNEKGIEEANQEILYYARNNAQIISGFSAQTINSHNGEIKITPVDKNAIFDQELNDIYSVKKFTFPDINVGSILEYKYTLLDKNILFTEGWRFQHHLPTLFSSYSIENNRHIDYKIIGIGEKLLDYFTHKKPEKKNRWILRNVPSYHSIGFIYNKRDMSEHILLQLSGYAARSGHFSDRSVYKDVIQSWTSLNNEVINSLNAYRNNSTAREIAALIPNGKDEFETLNNVHSYFKANFKWNGYYGIQAKSNNKDVARNNFGNSTDLNLLLNQILIQKGFDTEMVLISSRNRGKLIIAYPYLGQLDKIVNLIKLKDNSSYMIDASGLDYEIGYMPLNNYNHFGLILNNSKEEIISIQPPLSEYSSHQLYALKEDKILLSRTDKRNGYFKDTSKDALPAGMLERSIVKNSLDILMDETQTLKKESDDKVFEMIRSNLEVKFSKNSPFIGIENPLKQLISTFTLHETNRKRPLEFDFPYLYKISIEIPVLDGYKMEIPSGYNIHLEAADKSLAYYQKAILKEDKLLLQIEFYSAKSIYTDTYAEIKSFFEKANLSATKVILLKKV